MTDDTDRQRLVDALDQAIAEVAEVAEVADGRHRLRSSGRRLPILQSGTVLDGELVAERFAGRWRGDLETLHELARLGSTDAAQVLEEIPSE